MLGASLGSMLAPPGWGEGVGVLLIRSTFDYLEQ